MSERSDCRCSTTSRVLVTRWALPTVSLSAPYERRATSIIAVMAIKNPISVPIGSSWPKREARRGCGTSEVCVMVCEWLLGERCQGHLVGPGVVEIDNVDDSGLMAACGSGALECLLGSRNQIIRDGARSGVPGACTRGITTAAAHGQRDAAAAR